VTRRLNEWWNDQWSTTLGSVDPEDQSLDYQMGDESSYSVSPLVSPGGIAVSDSEKAEAPVDSL